jgi:hypothetical protein
MVDPVFANLSPVFWLEEQFFTKNKLFLNIKFAVYVDLIA